MQVFLRSVSYDMFGFPLQYVQAKYLVKKIKIRSFAAESLLHSKFNEDQFNLSYRPH